MEPWLIGLVFVALLFVLLLLGVHIAVALGLVGVIGFAVFGGLSGSMGLAEITPFSQTAVFAFTVLPLFILMGHFAHHGGIGEELYRAAYTWVGHISGGLLIATTVAAAAFAAASGSSLASAATFTRLALPEMIKHGYSPRLSSGAIAAAGTLAIMIPPSGMMVIYALFTNVSLGRLLIAGILPGILTAFVYMVVVYVRVRINPSTAPTIKTSVSWLERVSAIRWMGPLVILVVVVLGGIYFGVFTPTEAGAIGAFTALLLSLGRRKLKLANLRSALEQTTHTTAMIFIIIIGAVIFGRLLAISGLTDKIVVILSGFEKPMAVLALMLFIYLILGMFLENVAIAALTLPIFFPIIVAVGFDPVWFGVLVVKVCEIALLTPPVGMNCYVVKAAAGDELSLEDVFLGALPFWISDLFTLSLLVVFPNISLWLPSFMPE